MAIFEEIIFTDGELKSKEVIDYDTAGQVVKQNISGKYSFIFEYDQEGRTVLEERYLADNQLEYQSLYEYDDEGRTTKEVNLEFTKEYRYEYFD